VQTVKRSKLNTAIICLIFLELLVALCEIALALYYVMSGRGFIVSPTQPMERPLIILMVAAYLVILGLLLFCLLVFIKPKVADKRKLASIVLVVIEGILVFWLLYTIAGNLISNPGDAYFLVSLLWNIPRMIISTSLLICAAIAVRKKPSF